MARIKQVLSERKRAAKTARHMLLMQGKKPEDQIVEA